MWRVCACAGGCAAAGPSKPVPARFSRPTMPLGNLFRNCAHYWVPAIFVGYSLSDPAFVPSAGPVAMAFGTLLMLVRPP